MSIPPYAELTAAVRREGEAIVAAAKLGLDVEVPTCGAWTMADLAVHVAKVYTRAALIVGERRTAAPDDVPDVDAADPVATVAHALDDLVDALAGVDPATPVWNWSDAPDVAAFWARRMAHESAVHRFDAQRAHGLAQPIDAELAGDGFDELVDVIAPRIASRDGVTLPAGTYTFAATDEGSWHVRLESTKVERLEVAKDADVTVRGTTSALLLAAYGRVPWSSLEVAGDAALLDEWSRSVKF